MRMELQEPGLQILNRHVYNVFVTAHGLIMIFFAMMPALSAASATGLFRC